MSAGTVEDIVRFCVAPSQMIQYPPITARLYALTRCGPFQRSMSKEEENSSLHDWKCLCTEHGCRKMLPMNMAGKTRHFTYKSLIDKRDEKSDIKTREPRKTLCRRCVEHVKHEWHLHGGKMRSRVLLDHEVVEIGKREQLLDVLKAYHVSETTSTNEERVFIANLPAMKRRYAFSQMSQIELQDFLAAIANRDGGVDFERLCKEVLSLRERKIRNLQLLYPELDMKQRVLPNYESIGRITTSLAQHKFASWDHTLLEKFAHQKLSLIAQMPRDHDFSESNSRKMSHLDTRLNALFLRAD